MISTQQKEIIKKVTQKINPKVDLVTMRSLHDSLKPYVMSDLIRL